LQVFGANGYSRDCPVERMVRDARMFTIAGGTTQMLRNLIANPSHHLLADEPRSSDALAHVAQEPAEME
jgi:alkylation response protein AidB-like acyl-CoA dehydrogenase